MKTKTNNIATLVFGVSLSVHPLIAYDTGCGNPGNNAPPETCPSEEVGTNPINPMRGSLNREVTDIQTFGAAPVEFIRHYNSRTRDYTRPRWELGTQYTWQHNWQYEMRESGTSDFGFPRLIVRYPEGREYYFHATDASGAVRVPEASWGDRLYPNGTGKFILRTPTGKEYYFRRVVIGGDYQYLLDEVRQGTGWKWTLTYQQNSDNRYRLHRVTNNYGRYIQLARTQGTNNYWRITSVSTNDGRSVTYGYSTWTPTSETVLTSVNYPGSLQAVYTWCGADSLTSGPPLLASANDPMQSTSGARMRYIYNYTASYFTPPFGIVNGTIFEERNLLTDQVVVQLPLGSGFYPQILEGNGTEVVRKYENSLLNERVDGEGRVTIYTRDQGGWGYIVEEEASDGGITETTRDFAGRVLTRTDAHGGVTTFTYNANGFVLTETDALNRTTTHTRDASNRITRTDHPDGTYETFTYTGTGLMKTHRLRNASVESFSYDSVGNLVSWANAASHVTTYTFFSNGLRASATDPRGFTTAFQYDWRGNLTRITHPDGAFRQFAYNAHSKKTSETNELNHTTTFTYSEYLQVATITDPLNRTTAFEYGREPGCGTCNYLPTLSRITLPSGKITARHYDRSGKMTSETVAVGTPDAATTDWIYGINGMPEQFTDPRGKITTYTYDLLNRRTSETDPLNHTTTWTYDAVGNVLATTRADASVITQTFDVMDRLTSSTNSKNETTTYTYHAEDSLASLTDARGSTYTFLVDPLSRRTRMTYPGGTHEAWIYDGAGNATQYRARTGVTMNCTFDSRNRDTFCDWSDATPDVTRTYDAVGRLTSITNGNVPLAYTYDSANQLLSETYTFGGVLGNKIVTYTYDVDGNRSTLTYPDGLVVATSYTGRNQIAAIVADGPPPLAVFAYDLAGNRLSKSLENGTVATMAYDDAGRLITITHTNVGSPITAANYTYNAINLRVTGENGDAYTYDAADQVIGVTYAAGGAGSYTYDGTGNRVTSSDPANGARTYAANALNQYTVASGWGAPGYDTNGNITTFDGWAMSYDSANRLIGVENTGATSELALGRDARNRIIQRITNGTTTVQVYDEWNLIAEYDSSGTLLATYIHGPQVDEILTKIDAAGPVYYHQNALGSTVALTDDTGTLIESTSYDVFGVPTFRDATGTILAGTTCNNRFLYTGREWFAEFQIYDYRNRAYTPILGRFLQTDPIRFNAGDVNLYRYVSNNPVNWVDPFGLEKNDCYDCMGQPKRGNFIAMRCCARADHMYNDDVNPYPPEYTYMGISAQKMFDNTGSNDWSNAVRGCLVCMYKHGADSTIAHIFCYANATTRRPINAPSGWGDAIGTAGAIKMGAY